MKIEYLPSFVKKLKKKVKSNPQLKPKLHKQITLLSKNIQHPSLKVHKLSGIRKEDFSFWIEDNLRIVFKIIDDTIVFTDLITHDEY
ncbi:MAG: Addiction module toxin, RelE/StbE family [Candidatus Collierbacteria bacterium GW2011_GWB1_44_6]|uniref:Addiction module toxin, RelE/StbE family n=2 Tax=Candidatus Collieribacteriota TaxID=1752725 RepID=A0A0G1JQ97_9BACT|nr:MAG: Addiction module toxin, RelE/StbE family [Candidatus Collierbacteria bacterium GW2011_GWC2_43_12]KKT73575.1 MAG: Addiction module toxin, RelE/StbE family [Candidatus Collierbacteria bacterium GW2011_GWB1_44_6]KKT83252.1 MAG: Addiction module toxin, RelE/StbE family [Microgenomates group bacterium GW2011_GWC1_44_9]